MENYTGAIKQIRYVDLCADLSLTYKHMYSVQDAFTSPCVLRVFAEHLKAISHSVLSELDTGNAPPANDLQLISKLPEGALTMAICAVRHH
jgi:hypothetical protein